MALVNRGNGSGWFLTVILNDLQGDKTRLVYELRAADYAAAQAAEALILAALGPVTRSKMVARSLAQWQDEDTDYYPATESDASIKAVVSYKIGGSVDIESFEIPDPDPAIVFVATSGQSANIVNVSAAEVIAYADVFKSTGQAFISDGEDLDVLVKGKRTSRKRKR